MVDSVGERRRGLLRRRTEARGEWIGAAARELGAATARSTATALRRVLAGVHPATAAPLRRAGPTRVAGFDLTFSAPKSVSVLFGVGDADAAARRPGGARRRGSRGARLSGALGRRGASRARRCDRRGGLGARRRRVPAPDVARRRSAAAHARPRREPRARGRRAVVGARRPAAVRRRRKTASFVYQAVLRGELTRQLGVEWTPVRNGIAEVVGVPRGRCCGRSVGGGRRSSRDCGAGDVRGARAAEAAALATRRAKDGRAGADELVREWRRRAAELGLGAGAACGRSSVAGARRVGLTSGQERARCSAARGVPTGLTRRAATFARRDVVQALCERLPPARGRRAGARGAADRFLAIATRAVVLGRRREPGRGGRSGGATVGCCRSPPRSASTRRPSSSRSSSASSSRRVAARGRWARRARAAVERALGVAADARGGAARGGRVAVS